MRRLALLLITALIVAACGDSEGGVGTTAPAADTASTDEMMDETSTTERMDDEEAMDDDVLAVAAAEGDLGTFLDATEAAGIMENFHGDGPFTLFIPTDEAFAAYLEAAGMTQDEAFAGGEMLQAVLGYHVVTMLEDSEMVMGMDGQTFETMNGAPPRHPGRGLLGSGATSHVWPQLRGTSHRERPRPDVVEPMKQRRHPTRSRTGDGPIISRGPRTTCLGR